MSCSEFRSSGGTRPEGHAEACTGCAAWLAEPRAVVSALAALAAELDATGPRDVEAELRAAFRTRAQTRRFQRPWVMAAAAAFVMGLGLWLWRDDARVASEEEEDADLMFALGPPALDQDLEGGQIVRVRLSGTALRAMGIAAATDLPFTDVEADVLVGYDGVARAIRLASKQ